jgi:hypothetical protein
VALLPLVAERWISLSLTTESAPHRYEAAGAVEFQDRRFHELQSSRISMHFGLSGAVRHWEFRRPEYKVVLAPYLDVPDQAKDSICVRHRSR